MLGKKALSIAIIILILIVPSVQAYAGDNSIQDYLEDLWNSIVGSGSDVETEESSDIESEIDIFEGDATGQQVYDYYKAVQSQSGKEAAVIAVSKLIEPILDEYEPLGVHKSTALAQLFMESGFLSSNLSRIGNNPYGIKGDGYIGETDEYMDGQLLVLSLSFEIYDTFEDGIRGYCRLMMKSRYLPVRKATNYVDAAKAVKDCGYASDPDYVGDGDISNGKPIIGILDNIALYNLDQFDNNLYNSSTRHKYIWYDMRKQIKSQYLANGYLESRVVEVQQKLTDLGFYQNKIDGWYGNVSKIAVKAFQKEYDLYVDGVVGIYTYEALFPEKFTARIGSSDIGDDSIEEIETSAKWNASVSSYLVPKNSNNGPFTANMMTDGSVSTCWIPNNNRSGVGESITLKLSNGQQASFDSIDIYAGYGKSEAHYYTNYRIKDVSVYVDGIYIGDFELSDSKSEQSINLGKQHIGSKVEIEIKDCYQSQSYNGYEAWEDLCVSEVWVDGEVIN